MQEFLRDNHGKRQAVNQNERMELQFLRSEVKTLTEKLEQLSPGQSTADEQGSESHSSDCSSDGDVLDLPTEDMKQQA